MNDGLQIKEWSAGVICKLDIEFLLYLLKKDGFWVQVEELDSVTHYLSALKCCTILKMLYTKLSQHQDVA